MHSSPVITLGGLDFDLSVILMIVVTSIVVFVIARMGVRSLSVENPGKMQNFLEWLVEFVQGIISSSMPMKLGRHFVMLGITVIMFIFVANMIGLPFNFVTIHHEPFTLFGHDVSSAAFEKAHAKGAHEVEISWWKSPTADASVTMGLATLVIFMTHYLGIRWNAKNYFKHYFQPYVPFLPLNLIKEVSKYLTLGLRLYGNILAGEVMIAVIATLPAIAAIIPMVVWQAFSIFVGTIQAFVFTMLTMVYLSQTIHHEEEH